MAYTSIDDPSAHFQIKTYSGTGSTTSITNDGNSDLQPDWIWIKKRNLAASHMLGDSTRGTTKYLSSDVADAESTATNRVTAFNSDGFSLGNAGSVNNGSHTYVGWQWKCNGGTTSSNTTGSITTTVQANSDAGFNIVTYTGNGSNSNFGHGMGEQPDMVFVKRRNAAGNWCVWHKELTSSYYMQLDTTIDEQTGPWDGLDPSSGVVFVYNGALVNGNGDDYVAYIFKSKQGYSKFGKYVGNASTDGPFVYTGFKPAWLMIKNIDVNGTRWRIIDSKINPFNVTDTQLFAEDNLAENTSSVHDIDLLSNGFKIRTSQSDQNNSGSNILYMAFAENPFVTSTGIPTTAR